MSVKQILSINPQENTEPIQETSWLQIVYSLIIKTVDESRQGESTALTEYHHNRTYLESMYVNTYLIIKGFYDMLQQPS